MLEGRRLGLLLMVLGVLVLSPEGLLVQLAESKEKQSKVLLWKYTFASISLLALVFVFVGGPSNTLGHLADTGWHFVLGGLLLAGFTVCLSSAFMATSIVNVLVLFSLQPLWVAGFAWLWLKERPPFRTVIASAIGLLCAVVIFVDAKPASAHAVPPSASVAAVVPGVATTTATTTTTNATATTDDYTKVPVSTQGDLFALAAGVCFSGYLVVCRAVAKQQPAASMYCMTPAALAGVVLAALCVITGDVFNAGNSGISIGIYHWEAWLWIFLDGGVVIAGSLFLITIATQRILSSEAALIGLLATLFGPLFVFFGNGETPSAYVFVAWLVLLSTQAGHEVAVVREAAAAAAAAAGQGVRAPEPDEEEDDLLLEDEDDDLLLL